MRPLREALALAGLALQAAVVWHFRNGPPARIPMHFNAAGAPDSYGDQSGMAILLGATVLLYVLLTVVSFFPQAFNYPVGVTEENRPRLQAISLTMMGWLKVELVWLFAYLSWATIQVGLGHSSGLGWAFLPITLAVVGGTIAAAIIHMRRIACR